MQNGLFAALFFAAAIAMAGMPPLSGFLGKLLVLDALRDPGNDGLGLDRDPCRLAADHRRLRRAGSALFWKSTAIAQPVPDATDERDHAAAPVPAQPATAAEIAPAMLALAMLAGLAVFAGPVADYLEETSAQLFDRAGYISAVLAPGAED